VAPAELEELGESGHRGREKQLGDSAAESVEQDSDVLVLVVDADDDIVAS